MLMKMIHVCSRQPQPSQLRTNTPADSARPTADRLHMQTTFHLVRPAEHYHVNHIRLDQPDFADQPRPDIDGTCPLEKCTVTGANGSRICCGLLLLAPAPQPVVQPLVEVCWHVLDTRQICTHSNHVRVMSHVHSLIAPGKGAKALTGVQTEWAGHHTLWLAQQATVRSNRSQSAAPPQQPGALISDRGTIPTSQSMGKTTSRQTRSKSAAAGQYDRKAGAGFSAPTSILQQVKLLKHVILTKLCKLTHHLRQQGHICTPHTCLIEVDSSGGALIGSAKQAV